MGTSTTTGTGTTTGTMAQAASRSGKAAMANGYDPTAGVEGFSDDEVALLARRRNVLGNLAPLFFEHPVHVVSGEGAHLFDADGADYLDCYNNVACVGHANPHVREAVADQLGRQNTHTRYLQDEVVDYAGRLLGYFRPVAASVPAVKQGAGSDAEQGAGPSAEQVVGRSAGAGAGPDIDQGDGADAGRGARRRPYLGELGHVAFTNSGSEANDLALRMARAFTGHRGVVVTANAYHGITDLVSSVSPSFGTGLPLAPFLATVEVCDVLKHPGPDAAEILLSRFQAAFQRLHDAGYGVSAVLMDQIFSSDGILPDNPGWERQVAQAVHEEGGLFIADEVQSGFARTGEAFWGFQRQHADADLVVMGKPMGNGIPAGAVVYKAPIGENFAACTRYFNTFGGNPVSMRAAGAVLDEIETRDLRKHAKAMGDMIANSLEGMLGDLPYFGGIRHAGLFIGVDVCVDGRADGNADGCADGRADGNRAQPNPQATLAIIGELRARRILISASGADASTLKIRPPLVFTESDAGRLLDEFSALRGKGLFG
jgi:4-aminobutyrate aminotransferase-like enzyme